MFVHALIDIVAANCMCKKCPVLHQYVLTCLPLSEMVYRFEMTPPSSQRGILQYMVPWLCNVELLDDSPHPQIISQSDCTEETPTLQPTNPVLSGSGWGSTNGTRVVLHNLLYITAKVSRVMCGRWAGSCVIGGWGHV